jgi:beta-mannosidase
VNVVTAWRLLDTTPGSATSPDDLQDLWSRAVEVTDATVVGAIDAARERCAGETDGRDWWYATTLSSPHEEWIDFAGMTAPATIFLDNDPVAEADSMFLPVSVPVPPGEHNLVIHFPALDAVVRKRRPRGRWRSNLVATQGLRWIRTTLIGRAPVYSGVPPVVGFWRPVRIRSRTLARALTVTADARTGRVTIDGIAPQPGNVLLSLVRNGTVVARASASAGHDAHFSLTTSVSDPALWWPRGYGAQHLYTAVLSMSGTPLGEKMFGFRILEKSDSGDGFAVRVNGVDIFCRGAVWMPPDPVRVTSDGTEVRRHLQHLADAGANMLRIPGGTAPAEPEFWAGCADLGILVWHDAMQATFDPPAEIQQLLCAEIRELLRSESGNPALTVISGGNELIQQPEMLGLAADQRDVTGLSDALSDVVATESDALFVAASPSAPPGSNHLAIRPDSGIAHWFGVGGYLRPLSDVESARVRFAAECLAFSIPPTPAAIDHHFSGAAVAGHDPRWKAGVPRDRGSSWDFEDVRDHYVAEIFGVNPFEVRRTDPARYLHLGRLAVAEAMLSCYSYWRRHDSECAGALVLASKDLHPGAGWGLLDVDGRPKAPLEALTRIWSPIAARLSSAGLAGMRIDIYNDGPGALAGTLELVATNAFGARVVEATTAISVGAHSSATLHDSDITGRFTDLSHAHGFAEPVADAVQVTVLIDDVVAARDVYVIRPRTEQVLVDLTANAVFAEGGWHVDLTSRTTLRYVQIDVAGWRPTDNFFHLAGGLPYRVSLAALNDSSSPPRGSVTSIDALTGTRFTGVVD